LREGRKNIPIVQMMDYGQRKTTTTLDQLYVYAGQSTNKLMLGQIAKLQYTPETALIRRVNQYRAITVSGLPKAGHVASEVTSPLMPQIREFERNLPPGYRLEIVGELKEQIKGQLQSLKVVLVSALAIYLALVFQFKNSIKPLIVFAGIPFGAVGALASVWIMNMPMGFLAILGITSLIGVIVSHVIVLFDFIEERREQGAQLREALIDAGILRIRPVLITVGATVLALFPLALHGGPLWEALCYAQIGGLTLATAVTLFIVPVLYAIFVLDLKIIRWEEQSHPDQTSEPHPLQAEREPVDVVSGSDAETHVQKHYPHKTVRQVRSSLRPRSITALLQGMPLSFQRQAAGTLDATYHFVFTGNESAEATVTIRAGKVTVENGLLGKPNLKVIADAETWLGFLAGKRNLLWALLRRRVRLQGNPKWLLALKRCFPS
jgi:preprotein translocase subunit SecF